MILGVVVWFGNVLIFIDIKVHFKFVDTICDGGFSVVQTKFMNEKCFLNVCVRLKYVRHRHWHKKVSSHQWSRQTA
jgi:hypothetical protein